MWRTRNISLKTKMKFYSALILPVLMYGSECWTPRKEDERRLLVAEMTWLRRRLEAEAEEKELEMRKQDKNLEQRKG